MWIKCSEQLPPENGRRYLTWNKTGFAQVLPYYDGWNCDTCEYNEE